MNSKSGDKAMTSLNPQNPDKISKKSWFIKFLNLVERLGNLLPHPITLFAIFCLGVILVSGVAGYFELSVVDPRPENASGKP